MEDQSHRLGRSSFDAETGVLRIDGRAIDLGSRGGKLLGLLLARRGEVVSKRALIDLAWGDAAIEESNLSVQIARLRKLLGAPPDLIETVGRIGYRLREDAQTAAFGLSTPVLVMPLTGLDDAGAELARGLTEDLLTSLSWFETLSVIDASISNAGGQFELHGGVRAAGGHIIVGVRLLEASIGRVLWASRFEAARGNIPGMNRLVDAIAAQVELHVDRARAAEALQVDAVESAETLYRRARWSFSVGSPRANGRAIALFDRALQFQPENVTLLAGACEARAVAISMGWPAAGLDLRAQCEELARRGLALGAEDATSKASFGFGLFRTTDQDHGYALVQQAAGINPNGMHILIYAGTTAMHWGRLEVAEAHYRRALALAPLSAIQAHSLGGLSRIRMMQGRHRQALSWAERGLHLNENYGGALWTRIAAHANLGRVDDARRHLAAFERSNPGVSLSSIETGQRTKAKRMATTLEGLERAGMRSAN